MQHSMARDCRGDIGLSAFVTFRENFKCIFPYLQVFPNGNKNAKLLSFQYVGYKEKLESVREDGKGWMVAQSPTSVRVAQNLATHTPQSWEEKICLFTIQKVFFLHQNQAQNLATHTPLSWEDKNKLFTIDIFYIKRRFEMYLWYEDQKAWRLEKTYFNVDQPPNLANLACIKLAQPG